MKIGMNYVTFDEWHLIMCRHRMLRRFDPSHKLLETPGYVIRDDRKCDCIEVVKKLRPYRSTD